MSRILPLPLDAISQIHSSRHITSLQGVVLALLENSLDAGATKVEISVDFRRGGCSIEDNGFGIKPAEFLEDGGLCRMYHTSKREPHITEELHGSTGTYLASLAALSWLSITSRHKAHDEHATLTLHHGKLIGRHVPAPPGHELVIPSHRGTRVTIRDLFGKMPVRVKQRALTADPGAHDDKAWQELKIGVVALLAAWHKPCAVQVCDTEVRTKVLNLSGNRVGVPTVLTEKSLNQLGGAIVKSDIRDALPLLYQSGLCQAGSQQRWVPVSSSTSSIVVTGAISLEPAPTRQCQLISMDIHPCSTASGHNELYDAVNKTFVNSSFGSIDSAAGVDEHEKDRRKRDRRYKSDGYTQKQLQGRKGVDRWPMFVFQVRSQARQAASVKTDYTSDAQLKAIVEVLEATVTQWLASNHFRPQKHRQRKNETQQSPAASVSSPLRLKSGLLGSRERLDGADAASPTLKRPASTTSATVSKRRKIIDLSGRPASIGVGAVHHSSSTYFDNLTRVKSGREVLRNASHDLQKPAICPEGQAGLVQPTQPEPSRAIFRLPPLEVGELDHIKRSKHKAPTELAATAPCKAPNVVSLPHGPGDDFGDVDHEELLAATKAVEQTTLAANPEIVMTDEGRPAADIAQEMPDDLVVDWTDPVSKQSYRVNARTGVVLPRLSRVKQTSEQPVSTSRPRAAINMLSTLAGRPLSLSRRSVDPVPRVDGGWLPSFLKDWDNPVFKRQDQERIPAISFDGPGLDADEAPGQQFARHRMEQHFAEVGTSGTSKLSKAALKQVEVIRQVDEKFILCRMPSATPKSYHSTLVLVDQHAASERVILEGLLADLCAPIDPTAPTAAFSSDLGCKSQVATMMLERPQRFQASLIESELFTKYAPHFARWGILYDVARIPGVRTASQVRQPTDEHNLLIRTLPPVIAERCTLFPNLLIEMLRSEVFAIVETGARPKTAPHVQTPHDTIEGTQDHSWLRSIGSCPKAIIDMLNSRACRSAVMFNDVLTHEQCEGLLAGLSRCTFPFMCAHGRVNMVPLVELDGEEGLEGCLGGLGLVGNRVENRVAFVDAYRRWRGSDRIANEVN